MSEVVGGPARPGGYLGPEGTPYQGGKLLHNLLLFGRVCKALGMAVSPNRMIEVAHALDHVRLGRKEDFRHALCTLIVSRQRDLDLFDQAFDLFWRQPAEDGIPINLNAPDEPPTPQRPRLLPNPEYRDNTAFRDDRPESETLEMIVLYQTVSEVEVLRHKDFAHMTGEEIAAARKVMAALHWGLGTRRTRRLVPGKGDLLDLRRAFRANMRYAGEPLRLPTRSPKIKPRPLVLICDISGSMERYTRLLLHFMHTLAQSIYQVESFVFSTRLTRITKALRHKSVDVTLKQVSETVEDWGGGTRTGEVLHRFNYRWARRVLGRGAVVVLITDGWDRGDPDDLRREMSRLQRNAHRVIWLNPLVGGDQYQPLTRGAQAMLPFVDDFLPVRNLANLDMLAKELRRVDWRRKARSAHAHLILR
jgi:hypothetical protein